MTVCERIGCTLQELPKRMSPSEVQLWIARYSLKPWGDESRWMAKLLSVLLKQKDYKVHLPDECILDELISPFSQVSIADIRKKVPSQVLSWSKE